MVSPNRPVLLPTLLVLALACWSWQAFVPAPRGVDNLASERVQEQAVTAAAGTVAALGALPAHAVDNPLAHGAPGVMDANELQGWAERASFGGLLVCTLLAWWRGTLGSGQASAQADSGKPPAFWAMAFSNLALVVLLSNRWIESGHFPLSNMYESLSFLAWGVTAVTLYFTATENNNDDAKYFDSKAGGAQAKRVTGDIAAVWASPVALGIVAFAQFSLPKALQKAGALVPALQSNWLVMHVSVVMCSYATLLFGSVLCMAVLALSQPKESPITAIREAVQPALQGLANGLQPQPAVATAGQAMAMTGTTLDAGNTANKKEQDVEAAVTTSAVSVSATNVTVEFSSSSASAVLSEDDQLAITLDDLAYRSLLLGFGFLTIGIVSGAVWANEAWGNYWSWDPKETWALITWLVYAGYLHTRLQLGWDTRESAKIGAFGFLVVWVCYIGVNLMGALAVSR